MPIGSIAPLPTPAGLPGPELTDPAEIAAAIENPRTRLEGVVSMLSGLGVGVYHRDGTALTAGAERTSADLWLYEDEVRALAEMAALDKPTDAISFADWHAGLTSLGLHMSAADLATTFDDVYFGSGQDSFFVQLIGAMGVYFDPDNPAEVPLSRLQAWLLLADGFVVRPQVSAARPVAAGPRFIAQEDENRWGGASAKLPRLVSDADLPVDIATAALRLTTLARAVPFALTPEFAKVHEGHGSAGQPATINAVFQPYQTAYLTPFGDQFSLLAAANASGLPVTWGAESASVLQRHGEVRGNDRDPLAGPVQTDASGSSSLIFTPRQEEANGEGELVSDVVTLSVAADVADLASHTWVVPQVLLGWLKSTAGSVTRQTPLEIEWHEVRGLRINMTDDYDVTIEFPTVIGGQGALGTTRKVGTDHFEGFLAQQEDGTWRGIVHGTANAQSRQEVVGKECATGLAGSQDLLVTGEVSDYLPPGDSGFGIALRFYPATEPEIGELGCDYQLPRWTGPEGAGEYAPFNDQRIISPDIGFPTSRPPSGSVTNTYDEHLEGVGGGTWTVTIEVVEPEDVP